MFFRDSPVFGTKRCHKKNPHTHHPTKAVTKNFRGSPHIDQNDFSVQYALAVGDFPSGGELCVEEAIFVKTLNGLAIVEVLER